ncbi:MAG: FAD-dependent monooxygenase [Planctomycetota bacterium]
MNTQVLIVGAGPTGLMLANQLARRGVGVVIVDRHAGPAKETRALGVQARTLEIYRHLGVVDRALELGKRGTGANIWASGRRMARVPLGQAGRGRTPYPFILVLGQDDNERLLGDRLREDGVEVRWSTELIELRQEDDGVTAVLRGEGGAEERLRADWVAGCDGAHSFIREHCAVPFIGAPYEHVFYVADTVSTGDMVPDEVNVFLWKRGFHLFFPMRGDDHWRIVGILPAALRDRDGLGLADVVPSLEAEAGDSLDIRSCQWFSTYRIHHRCAARFRDGRCFLLGDAAHIHSPVGAQGMNTGLQDAYNLGWKLALVCAGRARAALLDTYEEERLPVARRLLATTDRVFKFLVSDGWLAGLIRTQVMARLAAFAMRRERLQAFAFRIVSQTGIHYRGTSLARGSAGMPRGAPRAGERFPWARLVLRPGAPASDLYEVLDDRRFHLLLFGQGAEGAPDLGDLLQVHEVPDDPANTAERARLRIPSPAFYLLRPDGHVGLCGRHLQAADLEAWLGQRLGLATAWA